MGHSSSRPLVKYSKRIYPSNTSNENPQSINNEIHTNASIPFETSLKNNSITMNREENIDSEETELARKIIGWEIDIHGYSAVVIDHIEIMQGVSNLYLVQFSFGLKMIFPIQLSNDIQPTCEDYIPIQFTYKVLENEDAN